MHIDAIKISLPLKKEFRISKGSAKIKTNMITVLNNRYIGEASGSVYLGPDIDTLEKEIKKGIENLNSSGELTIATLEEIAKYEIHAAARSALSAMVLNYLSGESKKYPWEILSLGSPVGIKSSMTFGIEQPDEMIKSIAESEFPIIKIKMGNEDDILILDGLDKVIDKEVRIDANGAWSCAKAEEMIFRLSKNKVTFIEQPTDIKFVEEWKHLKGKSPDTKIIMDEGLNTLEDYHKYAEFIDGVNIKMEKTGGIIEAIKIADAARKDKKLIMLGCMVESSVGIAQSIYMSSKADCFDLDGPLHLENDIADGIVYDRESIKVDREIIGGPKLKREILNKYINE